MQGLPCPVSTAGSSDCSGLTLTQEILHTEKIDKLKIWETNLVICNMSLWHIEWTGRLNVSIGKEGKVAYSISLWQKFILNGALKKKKLMKIIVSTYNYILSPLLFM